MTDEDIAKIAEAFEAFEQGKLENEPGFCAVAATEEIAKQDFILTPGRYVGLAEQEDDDGEPFEEKMTRLTCELADLFEQSHTLEDEIKKRLKAIGY
jgi:type I restriction enzyme M protein